MPHSMDTLDDARAGRSLVTIMETQAAIRALEPRLEELRALQTMAVLEAREAGVPVNRLSELLDVSQTTLYQILEREQERREKQPVAGDLDTRLLTSTETTQVAQAGRRAAGAAGRTRKKPPEA
jgi:hypothetical protein